jgi:hypothetical protein
LLRLSPRDGITAFLVIFGENRQQFKQNGHAYLEDFVPGRSIPKSQT